MFLFTFFFGNPFHNILFSTSLLLSFSFLSSFSFALYAIRIMRIGFFYSRGTIQIAKKKNPSSLSLLYNLILCCNMLKSFKRLPLLKCELLLIFVKYDNEKMSGVQGMRHINGIKIINYEIEWWEERKRTI